MRTLTAYPRLEKLALEATVDGPRHVELHEPARAAFLQRVDKAGEAFARVLAYDGARVWKIAREAVEDDIRHARMVEHRGGLLLPEESDDEVHAVGEMAAKRLEVERTVLRVFDDYGNVLPAGGLKDLREPDRQHLLKVRAHGADRDECDAPLPRPERLGRHHCADMLLHRYYAGIRKTPDCAANGIFARAKTLPELVD